MLNRPIVVSRLCNFAQHGGTCFDCGRRQGVARPSTVGHITRRQVLPNDRTPRLTGAAPAPAKSRHHAPFGHAENRLQARCSRTSEASKLPSGSNCTCDHRCLGRFFDEIDCNHLLCGCSGNCRQSRQRSRSISNRGSDNCWRTTIADLHIHIMVPIAAPSEPYVAL
jgi:hypothetical protein